MNFLKLKETRIKKKFDKNIKQVSESRIVSQKEIKSVGILTTASISLEVDLQAKIETVLGLKNVKIYSFKKSDATKDTSFKYFTQKDINWKGVYIEPSFKSFLEEPFDLLIGYFSEANLYLETAVLQSNATFKAGFSGVNSKLYELEVSEDTAHVEAFSSELKKYLQILKKLKN
ncbi:hypothetical protein H0I29_12370 [Polaribacter sp. R2A056_3_33]|jgi:hypothetical protein|uniref:DUF6913 domain-containing protein n=1 Tax=unclassified Polaribacter TaxID=196858 RepID=UPI001C4F641C|nr:MULTISPECIES: hypothetical protein [unclassified Polaribacter]QXP64765.1 hypothetical protein H0I27_06215 [Polaribacter sp. HaHaR_3_91]QXP69413.1 hypothetical protein H0I29_12370 [Polaribacter sp. R2A056_3_33]